MAEPLTAGAGDGPVSVALTVDTSGWERGMATAARASADAAKKTDAQFKQAATAVASSTNQIDSRFARLKESVEAKTKAIGYSLSRILPVVGGGGALGGVAAAGAAGLAGGLIALGAVGGKVLFSLATGAKDFAAELRKVTERAAEAGKAMDRALAESAEKLAAAVTPESREAELDRQIAELTSTTKGLEAAKEKAAEKLDALADDMNDDSWTLWVKGRLEQEKRKAESKLGEVSAGFAKGNDELFKLKKERDRLLNPAANPLFKGAIGTFTEDLNKQFAQIDMSPMDKQLDDIRRKFGALPGDIKKATEAADEFAKKTLERDQKKGLEGFYLDVGKQIQQFDMTPMERQAEGLIEKLKLSADAAKSLIEESKAFEKTLEGLNVRKDFDAYMEGLRQEGEQIGKNEIQTKLLALAAKNYTYDQIAAAEELLEANAALREADAAAKKAMEPKPEDNAVAGAAVAASRESQKAIMGDENRRGNPMIQAAKAADEARKKAEAKAEAQRVEHLRALRDILDHARQFPPIVISPI